MTDPRRVRLRKKYWPMTIREEGLGRRGHGGRRDGRRGSKGRNRRDCGKTVTVRFDIPAFRTPAFRLRGRLEDVKVGGHGRLLEPETSVHTFVAAKAALAPMRAQGAGSVIITSSNSGVQYDREIDRVLPTTKHAVVAMTRQMAADYAKEEHSLQRALPGASSDTPFNKGFEIQMGGRDKLEEYVGSAIPMGRFGTVEEIAAGIVYLASDQSSFMTGHALVIDGGRVHLSIRLRIAYRWLIFPNKARAVHHWRRASRVARWHITLPSWAGPTSFCWSGNKLNLAERPGMPPVWSGNCGPART